LDITPRRVYEVLHHGVGLQNDVEVVSMHCGIVRKIVLKIDDISGAYNGRGELLFLESRYR
jgi:hypothetical protein